MLTRAQANEIERLARVMATARVRRTVVGIGASANSRETVSGTQRAVRRATEALENYLESLTEKEPA